LAVLAFLVATTPSAALAQAAPTCAAGQISEITFKRQNPFLPEATAEGTTLGWLFRGMNSIHITTKERTVRWELLFEEGDCFDAARLQESERSLRTLPYIAEARVQEEQLPDGSHHVTVTTLDGWALTAGVVIEVEGGLQVTGISFAEKNLLGTGTDIAYFNTAFRERKRVAGLVRQPNLFGTHIDATFHGGDTRSGQYYSESLFRPFTGELGQNALRQGAHKRDDYFAYSVEPSLGFTQTLIRFEAEEYEATYRRKFGDEVGVRFGAGIGFSREVVSFPFGDEGVQIVLDDDFNEPMAAPTEVIDDISTQVLDYATNRVSFTVGVQRMRFSPMGGLDALRATQDIRLGSSLSLTVAPGFPSGDDNVTDVLTRMRGSLGITAGALYLLAAGDFQARNVSKDTNGGPTGWRSVLWELEGTGYWIFSENSALVSRVLYTAGSRMDRPFQLTLGGREAVRGYDYDAFPGARRLLATAERRIPFPGLSIPFADLGLAGFVDAGKMWAGDVPYGADSNWEASVGIGVRIGLPAGGQNVLRVDLTVPLTGEREEKGVLFRLYTELFGLLNRRSWPTQAGRSRWYGTDPDMTTRLSNPLAVN